MFMYDILCIYSGSMNYVGTVSITLNLHTSGIDIGKLEY